MSVLPLVLMTHPLPTERIASTIGWVRFLVGPVDQAGIAPYLKENLEEAEGILCVFFEDVYSDILTNLPRLRVVTEVGVDIDIIDIKGCIARKNPGGSTLDSWLINAKADLTMELLLCAARRVPEAY